MLMLVSKNNMNCPLPVIDTTGTAPPGGRENT